MYGDEDSDSSSSDEEIETRFVQNKEEEELEVFEVSSDLVSTVEAPVKSDQEKPATQPGPKRLVALMAASVAKHSGDQSLDTSTLPPLCPDQVETLLLSPR